MRTRRRLPQACKLPGRYPAVLFVVTGKGPQRASYEAQLRRLDLRRVMSSNNRLTFCHDQRCSVVDMTWTLTETGPMEAGRRSLTPVILSFTQVQWQPGSEGVKTTAHNRIETGTRLSQVSMIGGETGSRCGRSHSARRGCRPRHTRGCWVPRTWASACTPPPAAWTCP